jgi:hypothetical protein
VVELADTLGLEPSASRRGGSSPSSGITFLYRIYHRVNLQKVSLVTILLNHKIKYELV